MELHLIVCMPASAQARLQLRLRDALKSSVYARATGTTYVHMREPNCMHAGFFRIFTG